MSPPEIDFCSTPNTGHSEAYSGLLLVTQAVHKQFPRPARARARGYRNTATFITMIYLIATPIGNLFDSI